MKENSFDTPGVFKLLVLFGCLSFLFVRISGAILHPALYEAVPQLARYYTHNFVADTGASNAVSAVYLDYRVMDSLFEVGILLIAVTGILFIAGGTGRGTGRGLHE